MPWYAPTYRILGPLRMTHPPCPLCTQDQLNFAQQALTKTQKTQAQMGFYVFNVSQPPFHANFITSMLKFQSSRHPIDRWSPAPTAYLLFCICEILKELLTPAQPSFLSLSQVTRRSNPVSRLKLKRTSLFCRVGLAGCVFVSFWDETMYFERKYRTCRLAGMRQKHPNNINFCSPTRTDESHSCSACRSTDGLSKRGPQHMIAHYIA